MSLNLNCRCDMCHHRIDDHGGEVYCDECVSSLKDKIEKLEEEICELKERVK